MEASQLQWTLASELWEPQHPLAKQDSTCQPNSPCTCTWKEQSLRFLLHFSWHWNSIYLRPNHHLGSLWWLKCCGSSTGFQVSHAPLSPAGSLTHWLRSKTMLKCAPEGPGWYLWSGEAAHGPSVVWKQSWVNLATVPLLEQDNMVSCTHQTWHFTISCWEQSGMGQS